MTFNPDHAAVSKTNTADRNVRHLGDDRAHPDRVAAIVRVEYFRPALAFRFEGPRSVRSDMLVERRIKETELRRSMSSQRLSSERLAT